MMTTFVFRVRNVPAALYKAMGGFATNGVNMTKLESYQLGGSSPRRCSMPTSRAIPTTRVKLALEELRFFSKECASSASIRSESREEWKVAD